MLIALIFSFNAYQFYRIQRQILENQIREKVDAYTMLSSRPLVEAFNNYFHSGFIKFKELLLDILVLSQDVRKIELIDVNGVILFDSAEIQKTSVAPDNPAGRVITDPDVLNKIRGIEKSVDYHVATGDGEVIEVIYPFVEEWGKHSYTLRYSFGYQEMERSLAQVTHRMIQSAVLFVLLGILGSFFFAVGITGPVKDLAAVARQVGAGNLDVRVPPVRTRDELAGLASTFDSMICRTCAPPSRRRTSTPANCTASTWTWRRRCASARASWPRKTSCFRAPCGRRRPPTGPRAHSSPACPTSCEHRSIRSSAFPGFCCRSCTARSTKTNAATSPPSTTAPVTCWGSSTTSSTSPRSRRGNSSLSSSGSISNPSSTR